MLKKTPSNLSVKRISTSPYFKSDFLAMEKKSIEATGACYLSPSDTSPADVLITNTHTAFNELPKEIVDHASLFLHPNSGYDNYPAEFIESLKVPVIIGSPIRAQAVANYILSALFHHYTKIPQSTVWHNERKWKRKLLNELSVLIIGHGHIGKILEASLLPLVSLVNVFDPFKNKSELSLKKVDVVLMASSLHRDNVHMINKDFLNELNEDFLFINAARGALVKTQDLKIILQERPKAFAVLDVFENEPFDFSFFQGVENICLTSHIAGVYSAIDEKTAQFEALVISDFAKLSTHEFEKKYQDMNLKNRIHNGTLV